MRPWRAFLAWALGTAPDTPTALWSCSHNRHINYAGPAQSGDERTFLGSLVVLPNGQRIATRWGEIQAYAHLRGRPRPANDSWIVACCLVREVPLATLNIKDYAEEGLQLVR